MTTTTRLSLYKLFLPTTVWVKVTQTEYRNILEWLYLYKSRTSRRNAIDNLYETFVWFPTEDERDFWIPLGHMARLFDQLDARIPEHAVTHPNLNLRDRLRHPRESKNGPEVLTLRCTAIFSVQEPGR